jgi:hypothetical protein
VRRDPIPAGAALAPPFHQIMIKRKSEHRAEKDLAKRKSVSARIADSGGIPPDVADTVKRTREVGRGILLLLSDCRYAIGGAGAVEEMRRFSATGHAR